MRREVARVSNKEETNEELQEEHMDAIDETGVSEEETEMTELESANAELSEMEDKFLRARAEIANMSNRFKNERELLVRYRSQDLGKNCYLRSIIWNVRWQSKSMMNKVLA